MLSRRQMLRKIAAAAATALVAERAAAQAAKRNPEDVAYQTTPMGDQRCANCAQFTAPNICAILTKRVVPSGWCDVWMLKPS